MNSSFSVGLRFPRSFIRYEVNRDSRDRLRLEADRHKAEEDELDYLRKQITNCTIRAPQDGVVVHANRNRWWARPIEPGARVYQEQAMFLIPDLTQLESTCRSTNRWALGYESG